MKSLRRPQRQALALLLLLAVLVLLVGGVVQPLLRHYWSNAQEIEALHSRLELFRRLAAELPEQQQSLAQLQEHDLAAQLLFQEPRPALAAASLQQLVGQLVSQAGGQVISTQIMPRERGDTPLPEVALRVQMRGDSRTLVGVLHGLAYSQPLLLTQNLAVVSNQRMRPAQRLLRNAPSVEEVPPLDLSFTVVGYTRRVSDEANNEPSNEASNEASDGMNAEVSDE